MALLFGFSAYRFNGFSFFGHRGTQSTHKVTQFWELILNLLYKLQ